MKDLVVEKAPAKINLSLAINKKRSDGYHDLQTVFQTVSLYDYVEVELKGSGITCNCGELSGSDNLAYKAAAVFFQELYKTGEQVRQTGVQITIRKNIPAQAGLAGGSSDAAAVLRAMNKLYSYPFSRQKLVEMASKCGSDTSFCLEGGTQWAEGTGAYLSQLPAAPQMDIIVVKPKQGVNTAQAYTLFDSTGNFASLDKEFWYRLLLAKNIENIGKNLFNSFEEIILDLLPEIGRIKKIMLEAGCYGALLSGSGSAVFGILRNRYQGENLALQLREYGYKDIWLLKTVDSSEILK